MLVVIGDRGFIAFAQASISAGFGVPTCAENMVGLKRTKVTFATSPSFRYFACTSSSLTATEDSTSSSSFCAASCRRSLSSKAISVVCSISRTQSL